jgi:hypothetical protein
VFWKTISKLVWPAPLLIPAAVVVRLLVAHAGTVEPESAAEEEAGWATVLSVELVSLVAAGVDGVAVEAELTEEEAAAAGADDVLSLDPHAVSARPAVTSATAEIPRRVVLVSMVVPLP